MDGTGPDTGDSLSRGSQPGDAVDSDLGDWERFATAEPDPSRRRWRRPDLLGWVAIAIIIATAIGMVALRPTGEARGGADLAIVGIPSELHTATIVGIDLVDCLNSGEATCESVSFELTQGADTGAIYTQLFPPSALNPAFEVGAVAILSRRNTNAIVTAVDDVPCTFDPSATCRGVTLAVDGVVGPLVYAASDQEPAALLSVGDDAIVDLFPETDPPTIVTILPVDVDLIYQFSGDFQRRSLLLWATVLFAAAVVAIGLIRGVAALAGLTVSIGILLLFVLPAILDGRSPVLVAILGATAIAVVSLYLAHGFTRMTNVALIGMVVSLVLTAVLSALAVELAHFSGFTSEESTLLTLFDGIDVRGLLLAGIVLGTAGALDDVTVTQASAVWQLSAASPESDRHTLFARAMHIGRDHIASTVNTLLLAYAGAALPLFVLFVLSEQSLGAIANSEIVAIEIVRTLVGSIGLVAAVPVTTWLAAHSVDPGDVALGPARHAH